MSERQRILFISPFPYASTTGDGGATLCATSLRILKRDFDIGMVCFSRENDVERRARAELELSLKWFRVVNLDISKLDVLKAKLGSLFLNPEQAAYFNQNSMFTAIEQEIERIKPDILIFQFPQMAQFITGIKHAALTVIDVQDSFSISSFRKLSSAHGLIRKSYLLLQWLGWIRYERRYYSKFKQVWTLSTQDSYGLTAYSPKLSPLIVGLPLERAENRTFLESHRKESRHRIGFIGSFSHPPNIEALRFICEEIAPLAFESDLGLIFLIAGRNPPEHIIQHAPSNVVFLGFVERLSDFYDQVDVVIAPLLSGGGVKIKVAEAMLYGKAIVTTAIGAEGLGVQNGSELLVADSAREFVDHLEQLLDSEELAIKLEIQSRRHAEEVLDCEKWRQRVLKNLSEVL